MPLPALATRLEKSMTPRLGPVMYRPGPLSLLLAATACLLPRPACAAENDAADKEAAAALAEFRGQIEPLLAQYCKTCHSGEKPKGELRLNEFLARAAVDKDREVWEKIAGKLRDHEMPPEDQPQPDMAARKKLTAWIDAQLARFDCTGRRDPGRVTIRRLNRNEYDNTIRDLLGVDFHPADDFPSDDVGYGFDNIGDVLSMPTILLEKYLAAAEQIVVRALGTDLSNLVTGEIEGGEPEEGRRNIATKVSTRVRLFGSGDYIFRVRAWGDQAGNEPVRMAVYLDDKLVRRFEVNADQSHPQIYEGWLSTRGGRHTCSIAFENDYYRPELPEPHDRNLFVDTIELTGPYPPTFKKTIPREHTPEDRMQLAREIISDVMGRAYRRSVTPAEVDRVLKLVEMALADGESFNAAIGLGLQAILVSPHFLFRVELDPEPNNPDAIRTIDDYELATRLSYFLWSSMPDDELFTLARLGLLRKGDNLDRQVRRMLADPKAQALVENFAGQWLQLRNLDTVAPDKGRYPDFDEALRRAMRKETELFFAAIVREDRSVLDFIDADFSYLNSRLARHYGISDVLGDEFRRVRLDPNERGGVLTQASVLTVTSNPTRTSPVKRGKWILENILGAPPPPPPADVPKLKEGAEGQLTGSLRQRMEQHRANPDCAICHKRMDPLGFGLENYNAVGAWRTKDGPFEIDASGELPSGETFVGPKELKAILKARQGEFVRCLSEKMLTYGLGRGVEYSDGCTVEDIARAVEKNDWKFSSLILAVVHSDAFQKRSGKGSEQ
jgi:mono/diheme cytochrome c family protein